MFQRLSSPVRSRGFAAVVASAVVIAMAGLLTAGDVPRFPLEAAAPAAGASTPSPSEPSSGNSPQPAASPSESLLPSSAPSQVPSPSPLPPLAAGVVPILYMHRVEAPPLDYPTWSKARKSQFITYDVIPSAFAAQLDWLQANGYTTILPRDLAAHWDHGTALPPRPVILTFDDGSADWTGTILPLLKSHGMVAEFYLTLDAIANGWITWSEVKELAAAGNGIGAHDVHHVQLAMLGADRPPASPDVMWYEVHQARLVIGANVGRLPDSMAYVGGGFDAELELLVKRAGYTTARAIIRGIDQGRAKRFELRVVRIGPRDDVVDVVTGELVPGLPVFTMRMAGVSDLGS